jgi:hypothetical protein
MTDLRSSLFSPLDRNYCLYFYYLSVFAFIFLLLTCLNGVYLALKGKADIGMVLLSLAGPFLLYFNNRLLYSMCSR